MRTKQKIRANVHRCVIYKAASNFLMDVILSPVVSTCRCIRPFRLCFVGSTENSFPARSHFLRLSIVLNVSLRRISTLLARVRYHFFFLFHRTAFKTRKREITLDLFSPVVSLHLLHLL